MLRFIASLVFVCFMCSCGAETETVLADAQQEPGAEDNAPMSYLTEFSAPKPVCSTEPAEILTGGVYSIVLSGFNANERVILYLRTQLMSDFFRARTDQSGSARIERLSDGSGAGSVTVYRRIRSGYRVATSCDFVVQDAPCVPTDCMEIGAECGVIDDGCGALVDCGSCNGDCICTDNKCMQNTWPDPWTQVEQEVLDLVNARRAEGATCGSESYAPARPLAFDMEARLSSRLHSADMATNDYFSHTGLDDSSFMDRMQDAGWSGSCPCGENIAAGYSTASAVVSGWMQSPGHCSNIMNDAYTVIGVGYGYDESSQYRHYWTQNFGVK